MLGGVYLFKIHWMLQLRKTLVPLLDLEEVVVGGPCSSKELVTLLSLGLNLRKIRLGASCQPNDSTISEVGRSSTANDVLRSHSEMLTGDGSQPTWASGGFWGPGRSAADVGNRLSADQLLPWPCLPFRPVLLGRSPRRGTGCVEGASSEGKRWAGPRGGGADRGEGDLHLPALQVKGQKDIWYHGPYQTSFSGMHCALSTVEWIIGKERTS